MDSVMSTMKSICNHQHTLKLQILNNLAVHFTDTPRIPNLGGNRNQNHVQIFPVPRCPGHFGEIYLTRGGCWQALLMYNYNWLVDFSVIIRLTN